MSEKRMSEKRKIETCSVLIDDDDIPVTPPCKKVATERKGLARFLKDEKWYNELKDEFQKDYFKQLEYGLEVKRKTEIVYPDDDKVFEALNQCPFDNTKVVIIAQDPYTDGNAMGLAFSVPNGRRLNPSLQNIFKEIKDDTGQCGKRLDEDNGDLTGWAKQGVYLFTMIILWFPLLARLLLNTVLTVKKAAPGSHAKMGWEKFTDQIIRIVNQKRKNVVFLLWGKQAQEKAIFISKTNHKILQCSHPSPMSVGGFFGKKHFSACNQFLKEKGLSPIDWDA